MNCAWTISSIYGNRILLQFSSFSLEYDSACDYDYLEIYDGMYSWSRKLGKYCGKYSPGQLISSGSKLHIIFHSDVSGRRQGFVLNFYDTNATAAPFLSTPSTTSIPVSCGRSLLYTPGILKSPGYPYLYPNDIDCAWTISSTNGKHIRLQFLTFSLETNSGCGYDYLEVYDGVSSSARKLGKYCGTYLPQKLVSSGSELHIVFHTDGSGRRQGFFLNFNDTNDNATQESCGKHHLYSPGTLKSPGYPNFYPNNMDCEWLISDTKGKPILLKFLNFSLEDCEYDYLDVYDGDSAVASKLGRFCLDRIPRILISSGSNIFIVFHTDSTVQKSGFVLKFSSTYDICGKRNLHPPGTLQSPFYPSLYPDNIDCSWIVSTTKGENILLKFSLFSLESRYMCEYDYLDVFDGDSANATRLGRFCGEELPRNLVSSSSKLLIVFHTDRNEQGYGFSLKYSTTKGICGEITCILQLNLKVLFIPLYTPITLTATGLYLPAMEKLSFSFLFFRIAFKIENYLSCSHDYLDVYDGDSAHAVRLGRYCGNKLPINLVSSGSKVFIAFHTDGSQRRKGFVLKFLDTFGSCGRRHLKSPGELRSPRYPSPYANNIDCNWIVSSRNGGKILLQFLFFSTESDWYCRYDYLDVYDGNSAQGTKLGRYCGNKLPRNLTSSGSELLIVFHTDGTQQRNGFILNYSEKFKEPKNGTKWYIFVIIAVAAIIFGASIAYLAVCSRRRWLNRKSESDQNDLVPSHDNPLYELDARNLEENHHESGRAPGGEDNFIYNDI
ncbi:tolloid-like protein 1 [Dendronephthya gigantea]|uniref:tolloid-like protein 1 n=1 Tax=Dendronephthya gigantea TaxID=151771 RepID=UPI00106B603C|nr:tolloid-like protein 1 [Dendronephthya gigantea]